MKIIKALAGVVLAVSALCLLVTTVLLINILLINSLPLYVFWEVLIIVNTLIAGGVSGITLKMINDTEEQATINATNLEIMKEVASQQRVEESAI